MTELRVVIPGPPHGMGRPRAVIRGGHASVHQRDEDSSWKAYASGLYRTAATWSACSFCGLEHDPRRSCGGVLAGRPEVLPLRPDMEHVPYFGAHPVAVEILAVWPCPKSARKADKLVQRPRVGKPDADNIAKAVCDAGNGVLWLDDAQVAELHVRRIVGREGEAPRVEVVVRSLSA